MIIQLHKNSVNGFLPDILTILDTFEPQKKFFLTQKHMLNNLLIC